MSFDFLRLLLVILITLMNVSKFELKLNRRVELKLNRIIELLITIYHNDLSFVI